jgi:hypothetical protein
MCERRTDGAAIVLSVAQRPLERSRAREPHKMRVASRSDQRRTRSSAAASQPRRSAPLVTR